MEWIQVLTIIATTVGCCVYFHQLHREDMRSIREDMKSTREDMKDMDAKWERLFEMFLTGKVTKLKKSNRV